MARDGDLDETVSGDSSERVRDLIADCLRRRAAGETVPDQSIIDAHPELMPDLADELRKLGLVEAAWEKAADGKPHAGHAETLGPAGLHIRCPHCHNPVEVVIDAPLTDIACSACGSHFSFVGDDNAYTTPTVRTIGHFETIEHLGTGAFGAVWKARDTELDRTVALKIPRKGQLTPAETEQFLREARAAAQLRHPNIVNVHEVGREGDTLFIVSDLVRGVSLSDWLSALRLTSREAGELCVKLAEALHHAHEAGVIHRDLKPSNIMMDASGEPHIMDFGLAKREAGEITVTLDGRPLGTPAYMSPEQAQGQAHLATGRSDIYSLGVIFFELLTGELPFRGNSRMLIHQVIHDEAPSPRKLNNSIPRDLETICLKCLAKEPARRYASAGELSADILSYLNDKPIVARRPSRLYRLGKFTKRNKALVGGVAAVFVALVLGVIGTGTGMLRLRDEQRATEAARLGEMEARREADAQRQVAESKARQAETGLKYVEDTFSSARPERALGKEVTVVDVMDKAARTIGEQLADQPSVEARIRVIIGRVYGALGQCEESRVQFVTALEIEGGLGDGSDPQRLRTKSYLGFILSQQGKDIEAMEILGSVLVTQKHLLGEEHEDTRRTKNYLALSLLRLARYKEAEKLFREILAVLGSPSDEQHPDALLAKANLAAALHGQGGKDEDAEELLRQVLPRLQNLRGSDHPDVLTVRANLAVSLLCRRKYEDAEREFRQALADLERVLGKGHPDTLTFSGDLAVLLAIRGEQGRDAYTEAEKLLRELLPIQQRVLGDRHPVYLRGRQTLAITLRGLGRLHEAEKLLQETLDIQEQVLPAKHPDLLVTVSNLADCLRRQGRRREADDLLQGASGVSTRSSWRVRALFRRRGATRL